MQNWYVVYRNIERYKQAAEDLDKLAREERDLLSYRQMGSLIAVEKPLPKVVMNELMLAMMEVLRRAELNTKHLSNGLQ